MPVTDWPWDGRYDAVVSKFNTSDPEYVFFNDLIQTVNRMLEYLDELDARITALEP